MRSRKRLPQALVQVQALAGSANFYSAALQLAAAVLQSAVVGPGTLLVKNRCRGAPSPSHMHLQQLLPAAVRALTLPLRLWLRIASGSGSGRKKAA